jgi:hypothetical protein
MSSSTKFSDIDDNKILEKMKLLNSDYVDSIYTFAEGFSDDNDDNDDEGFADDNDDNDDEGFSDDNDDNDDEGFSDDELDNSVEGMKSKSKSKSPPDPEFIPKIDMIDYLIRKAGGSSKDVSIAKKILTMLFTTFLSFLIAHNWYSNFFTYPVTERLSHKFSSLKENEFIDYISTYVVQLVSIIDEYVMVKIPTKVKEFTNTSAYFGRRTVFYVFISVSLGLISFFLRQFSMIIEYIRKELNKLINVIRNYASNPVGLRNYFRDLINAAFNQIFLFKGNPVLSSILGISYLMVFTSNIIADKTKGIFENVFNIIPASMTKLAAGNIFYLIYLVFKFAMFYQPTIAFSSFIVTIYFFYYSIMKTGIKSLYSLYQENDANMNDGRVAFKTELFGNFQNGIENFLKVITNNFHEIVWFFSIRRNFADMFTLSSNYLKTLFLGPGIMAIFKIIYHVLSKYGIGTEELNAVSQGISEINKNVDFTNYIEKKFEKEEDPNQAKEHFFANMFEKIYHPYKTA